ncbi:MAG: hypothetical protein A2Y38_11750 [Spirochaetes bacterium GWB1_59_5]|nr:MAG: hypothetical protein A2Y38_11750 [Spirochaetes bacterium GWB1_59_5]
MIKDPEKRKKYNAAWYKRNAESHKRRVSARNKKIVAENAARLRGIKEATPCADCGLVYPYYIMDCDHIRGVKTKTKSRTMSALLKKAWSWSKVLEELSKCDIVCANCHRARTYKRKIGSLV